MVKRYVVRTSDGKIDSDLGPEAFRILKERFGIDDYDDMLELLDSRTD